MAFKIFRLAVGLVIGATGLWLIGNSAPAIWDAFFGPGPFEAQALVMPGLKILAVLLMLAVCYYGLWSDSRIKQVLENIFSIPELIRKIGFTLALLCIYRIGFHVPLPGLDQEKIASWIKEAGSAWGQAIQLAGMFTGGNLQQSTLFGLGIMPYISASIIFQLLTTVVPSLEKLMKEGPAGQKKIQEYTRYATVLLCIIQATVWMRIMMSQPLVYDKYVGRTGIFVMGVMGLTAGTIFLMWLGEQIDEYGIGNGISILIMAGIVARLPHAIINLVSNANLSLTGATMADQIGPGRILFLMGAFVFVVAGAILITQAQRRIPVQQAKHTRGRKVYGGQRQYLPLRVNHGGVMPIIFASSLMIFPGIIFKTIMDRWHNKLTFTLHSAFQMGSYTYVIVYIALIFFFAYFWTTVQFRPKELAEHLRDSGSFIPGLRPGKRTTDYLERVMERITYCGAAFLAVIAVIPSTISAWLKIDYQIAAFLGGTGLLIMVSVALDLVQRIEANLVMRNYGGFLTGSARIKGAYG